jgi:hypothetical protein
VEIIEAGKFFELLDLLNTDSNSLIVGCPIALENCGILLGAVRDGLEDHILPSLLCRLPSSHPPTKMNLRSQHSADKNRLTLGPESLSASAKNYDLIDWFGRVAVVSAG